MMPTMNSSFGAEDPEQLIHDQLPSPEGVFVNRSSPRMEITRSLDALGVRSVPRGFSRNDEGNQLPSAEELKTSTPSSSMNQTEPSASSRKKWIMTGSICAVLLVVAIVAVAVGVSQSSNESGSSSENGVGVSSAERLKTIMDFLVEEGVSDSTALETSGSPQQLAANFLAKSDPGTYPVPDSLSSSNAHRFVQRYALTVFFHAMSGDTWRNRLHFATNTNECLWYAIAYSMDGSIFRLGVECNAESQVIALRISGNSLKGGVPSEMGLLPELQVLSLHFNSITLLPESMRQLKNLKWLSVHYNLLKGPIPDWLSELDNLQTLALSNNEFSGTIPSSLSSLTKMDTLALDDNELTGDLSVVTSMTIMRRLYLEDNQFTGTIDDSFLVELPGLEDLDLSDNLFQGTVPTHFLRLEKLRALDLHGNSLGGSLPLDMPVSSTLEVLTLHGNNITGSIPDSIRNLQVLTHLDLSSNKFTGSIRPALGSMASLTYLFLAENDFETGVIPDFLQNLVGLKELSLKSTQRTGPIPDWMGNFSDMVLLDLDDNGLNGTVNPSLGDLSNLRFLLLNRNQLDGIPPEELENLSKLDMLLLQDNLISGTTGELGCESTFPIAVFVTDCSVTCECCTLCCSENEECEDREFLAPATNDPIWEKDYDREFFVFGQETTFDDEDLIQPP